MKLDSATDFVNRLIVLMNVRNFGLGISLLQKGVHWGSMTLPAFILEASAKYKYLSIDSF